MAFKIAQPEVKFDSPGPQPNGLQATSDGLWSIDQVEHKIYLQDFETGEVLFESQTDTVHASGITLGEDALWVTSTYECKVAKLDPATGETIAKYESPGSGVVAWMAGSAEAKVTGAHGIEYRDSKLYIAAPPSQRLHVMDVATWEEVNSFPVPGLRVHGIAWSADGDGRLWIADTSAGTVNLMDVNDGRIHEVIRVEAPVEVHGMTMHEGVLWYCDAHTQKIGRLALPD